MGRVEGKVALVTGGASGLGEACAKLLAAEGAALVIADRDAANGERVAGEINKAGGRAAFIALDVTVEPQWLALGAAIRERHGRLDIAVNSAGTNVARSFPSETTLDDWHRVLQVNLDGVFLGTKHALALMRESQPVAGSIINISSMLGLVGQADSGPYCASKGGVRLYTKSVALSCADQRVNVRVNSVHPGFIETPLLRTAFKRFATESEARAAYDALVPIGHIGQPEDVAYGVLYLASDESKFVTGSELVIDGGFTAR
ncbi:MAG: glucose 1-dehydrogenase [Acidobacteria bacterium]|nr:glucose 1-dehydrogenase [Acidobacteriota bacterium]